MLNSDETKQPCSCERRGYSLNTFHGFEVELTCHRQKWAPNIWAERQGHVLTAAEIWL